MSGPVDGQLQSLAKSASVVQLLAAKGEQSISEVSAELGLSKTGAHRIVSTLREVGLAGQDPRSRRYHLSPLLWEYAVQALQRTPLFELAVRQVQFLARRAGCSTNLSLPDGAETLFVLRVGMEEGMPLTHPISLRRPAYCNAAGKAMLAFQDPAQVERVLEAPLLPITPSTITDPVQLREELQQIRAERLAYNRGEMDPRVHGLASPIFNSAGEPVAALALAARPEDFTPEFVANARQQVLAATREVSRALGFRDEVPGASSIA